MARSSPRGRASRRASPAPHGHPIARGSRSVPVASGSPTPSAALRDSSPRTWAGLPGPGRPLTTKSVVVLGRDVTLIDAATGRETDLGTTLSAEDGEGYAVHTLVWSPDGTRITYDG